MLRASIICDTADAARTLGERLEGLFDAQLLQRRNISSTELTQYTVVDIDLTNHAHLPELRSCLKDRPKAGKVIVAIERGERHQAVQAFALGATDIVTRPVTRTVLLAKLFGEIHSLAGGVVDPALQRSQGILAAIGALQDIFAAACFGTAPDLKSMNSAGEAVISHIEADGLVRWIDSVRKHHSQTYQHCLLVTGIAVGFASQLGFSTADRQRLALAGLLHDIGKAKIPLAILEKPGPLDRDEASVMRQHPVLGYEAIQDVPELDASMLDMVIHHHEYLDGSGYPHGLTASELSDLVRMMTIADIFGALIERRPYKAPMTAEAAYEVLRQMESKLDTHLVREFAPVSRVLAGR